MHSWILGCKDLSWVSWWNFLKFDKAKKGHYLLLFEKTTYNGVSIVGEHITSWKI